MNRDNYFQCVEGRGVVGPDPVHNVRHDRDPESDLVLEIRLYPDLV